MGIAMQKAVHAYACGAVHSHFMSSSSPGASLFFMPYLGERHERTECTREEEGAVVTGLPLCRGLREALSSWTSISYASSNVLEKALHLGNRSHAQNRSVVTGHFLSNIVLLHSMQFSGLTKFIFSGMPRLSK